MWFDYAQQKADARLEVSFDEHQYNDSDLITIRIPLSMPYQTMQSGFERVDGEVAFDGKIYKYVKRKIDNGELVLMCLPDNNKMRIQSAKDEFFKYTNDLSQANTSKKSDHSKAGAFKNLLGEYDQQTASFTLTQFNNAAASCSTSHAGSDLPFFPHTPPVPPPDFI